MSTGKVVLQDAVEKTIRDAHDLLGSVLERSMAADKRAKIHKSKWSERHRLHVLMEAANESARILPSKIREPWLVAELRAILDVVKIWKEAPHWHEIESSLVSPSAFSHIVATLMLAEHLRDSGHMVELVPTKSGASPDLRVQAIGGRRGWIQIECYQPRVLAGKPTELSLASALKVMNQAMAKAKRQLGNGSGIFAICTYNQARPNLDTLGRAVVSRLRHTPRARLSGVMIFSYNNVVTTQEGELIFRPVLRVEFIKNPAYSGPLEVITEGSKEYSRSGSVVRTDVNKSLQEIFVE
jgi:hypothetical protein